MVMFGSSLADGNLHSPINVPTMLAGRGGNRIGAGQHIAAPALTPLCNLLVTMLAIMGIETEKFGDSNGNLNKLLLV
jgi:hypothetical protein